MDVAAPSLPSYRSLEAPLPRKRVKIESLPTDQKKVLVRNSVYDQVHHHPDSERAAAVMKWSEIFMMQPEATAPGKMLLRCAGSGESAMRTSEDMFRKKATSTIKQRAGSLGVFLAWFNANKPN